MKNILTLLVLMALLCSLPACTIMKFNGDMSKADSLEMSNVKNRSGEMFVNDEFTTRGWYLIGGLIPIMQEELPDAVGECREAHDLEITSEYGPIDIAINYIIGVVSTRGYELRGEKK